MMKQWAKSVGMVLVAGSLVMGGLSLSGGVQSPSKAYAAEDTLRNTISVVGKGEVSIKPDIVYLSIGVTSNAETAKEAQKQNAAKIQKLTTLLKGTWGIADKDIQTGQFYVQPNYTYTEKDGQQVKGYIANHTLEVAYRDMNKVGALLDAAADAGANNVGNARFSVEDPTAFESQAIDKAMASADAKAAAIAKAAKRSVGAVINIAQNESGSVPLFYEQANMLKSSADSAAGTAIETGEVKVTAQLSVMYEMK